MDTHDPRFITNVHPLVIEAVRTLPDFHGGAWTERKREQWLTSFRACVEMAYPVPGEMGVPPAAPPTDDSDKEG